YPKGARPQSRVILSNRAQPRTCVVYAKRGCRKSSEAGQAHKHKNKYKDDETYDVNEEKSPNPLHHTGWDKTTTKFHRQFNVWVYLADKFPSDLFEEQDQPNHLCTPCRGTCATTNAGDQNQSGRQEGRPSGKL